MSCLRPVTVGRPPTLVRPTLDAYVPSVPWEQFRPLMSVCVLLPISWEAAFATSCLRRIHPLGVMRRFYSQSSLPHGDGLIGHVHQGYLACALGPG